MQNSVYRDSSKYSEIFKFMPTHFSLLFLMYQSIDLCFPEELAVYNQENVNLPTVPLPLNNFTNYFSEGYLWLIIHYI